MSLLRVLLVWIVIALVGALAAHFFLAADPGYVLIRHGGMDRTTTLVNAIVIALGAMVLFWLVVTLIALPFRSWGRYRETRAQSRFGEGLEALHHGHYTKAEKLLAQSADETPHYESAARLAAAQAALARDDAPAAQAHLNRLGERHPATRAIALAELAMRDERPIDALAALEAPAAQPLPPRGLALRADAWALTGHASEAYGLLGALRRQHALPDSQLAHREVRWAAASLREADDGNGLAERWEALPKGVRTETPVVLAYVDRAVALGWHDAATRALETALDARWDERLVSRYAALEAGDPAHRRTRLERWLQTHPASSGTMLGLSRLHHAQRDWPQARDYLQRAIEQGAGRDAWVQLGDNYAASGDERNARLCYANALRAADNQPIVALPSSQEPPVSIDAERRDSHGLPTLPDDRDLPPRV
ncbi:heme biosynthesis HemY N-terminal domain-containing protein [Luteimonas deserti]|uniref:Tetratricopeptide repeat protein n=1 Tax=Luteimonas deserti TaxID=2752306 RepID=A0A7Z0TT22_9GAMM|nr:heme biosynthesis HemY N-terminal domain-containing protein [Luteimonas deserti]NYZ61356.1 tetratricopeptide repeat protein [Luteimonas deserti]